MADTSTTKIDVLDATQKVGERWVSAVKQSQSIGLDVARAFAKRCRRCPPAYRRLAPRLAYPTSRRSPPAVSTSRPSCSPRRGISL
jgi:hypothetical protein